MLAKVHVIFSILGHIITLGQVIVNPIFLNGEIFFQLGEITGKLRGVNAFKQT